MYKRSPIDMPFKERLWCSYREAADRTSLSERKLRKLAEQGRLKTAKIDKRTIVDIPSLLSLGHD